MIKIISDSTCDLPLSMKEKYGIKVIPLHIHLGENSYSDGINIGPEDVFDWSELNKTAPETSRIEINDALSVIQPMIDNGDEVIVFSLSKALSKTYDAFNEAASLMHATSRMSVIDSETVSSGIGLLVLETVNMIQSNKSKELILGAIEGYKSRIRSSFVVDSSTYIKKSGKVKELSTLTDSMFNNHTCVEMKNGELVSKKKYRGKMEEVYKEYLEDLRDDLLKAKKDNIFITHTGLDEESLVYVENYIKALEHFDNVYVTQAGGVVSSNCGPHTLGVFFIGE